MEMGGRRIPEDVMVEILKRLPVKSLLRFKSTSKEWCAVIKSPNFIKSHLRFSPKSNNGGGDGFLFNFGEKGSPDENPTPWYTRFMMLRPDDDDLMNGLVPVKLNTDYLDSIVDFDGVLLHGCCDGILCLSDWRRDRTKSIILWNPATRQFKSLPNPTHIPISHENKDEVHDKDEVHVSWQVAFGSDSKNDDYKVVAFISVYCGGNYTGVYSINSNSWRLIDPVIPFNPSHWATTFFFNAYGFLHRMVSFNDHNHESNVLLSLDMEDWVYRVTSGPPSQCISSYPYDVVLSKSSNTKSKNIVAMYYHYGDIEVWELNDFRCEVGNDVRCEVGKGVDDRNHWTLKYKYELDGVLRPLCLWTSCLLLMKMQDEDDVYSIECTDSFVSLYLYDRCTEITKSVSCELLYDDLMNSTFYKETLVSLT